MKYLIYLLLPLTLACGGRQQAEPEAPEITAAMVEPVFFELRTYYCYPGKRDALLKRFEDHTMGLFEKHGMVNMAYWTPMEGGEDQLVYLMGYPDRAARDSSWAAFGADPEWKAVYEASHQDGPIVDSVGSVFLTYTDYSPHMKAEDAGPRVFSLRTYWTNPGKLPELHARFRDHTLGIFERNGMTNIAYFDLDAEDPGHDNTLMYLITFPDTTARAASWKSFLEDPDWKSAYEASIVNGRLVDSIQDDLLVPTRFSPLK